MRTLSDPRRFCRLGAGLCMIGAPLTLLVGALLHPDSGDSTTAHIAAIAANPGRNYASHTMVLVGLVLFLGVILGLVHLLRQRAPAAANIGGALAIVGVFGATSIVAVDGIAFTQIGQPDADAQEMAALLDRITESAGARAIAVVGALSFLVGMLVLAYGLWRTRAVHPWVAPGVAAAAIVFFVGQVTDSSLIFAVAFAAYLVTLGLLGRTVLSQSDDEWEGHPPTTTRMPAQPAAP
jgi:hypothetical protein